MRTMPIAMVGAGIMMLGLSYETGTRFRQIKAGREDYPKAADPRGIWISEIRGYFGYGGMIHNFKNYVLRHDQKYADALHIQTRLLLEPINAYRNATPDPLEQAALSRIRKVVENMRKTSTRSLWVSSGV